MQPRTVAQPRIEAPSSPAPTAPGPASQAAAPIQAPTPSPPRISTAWAQALEAWLASHRIYPQEAQRRDEQGTVTLRFTVEPSGRVVDVAVARSSGSPRLDAAAEAMLQGARVPPFDASMRQEPITTTVPIRYRLED
jgi:periplasmic protein TonB